MNTEPQSIPPKNRRLSSTVFWLALFTFTASTVLLVSGLMMQAPSRFVSPSFVGIGVIAGLSLLVCGWTFVRCFCNWRNLRRGLIGLAMLATLVAVFYAVENWRGQRAWEQCKRELEAKGEVLDWPAFIPSPVPNDQNVFKAPKMTEWFVRLSPESGSSNELSAKLNWDVKTELSKRDDAKNPIPVMQLVFVPPGFTPARDKDVVVSFDAPNGRERLAQAVQDALGPSASAPQKFTLVSRPLSQMKPGRVLLEARQSLSAAEIFEVLPDKVKTNSLGQLRIETDSSDGSLRVLLVARPAIPAGEYLAWSDKFEPDFDLIREALKRPHAQMERDFQRPFEMPIIGYVNIRIVAQTAAQRAQSCLLLGRSEQAFRELSLIHELRRLLKSKPVILISAMVDVAVVGLYVDVIGDGLRLQAWREPELNALQEQLREINLLPVVADSFREERAAVCHAFNTSTARQKAEMFVMASDPKSNWWSRITNPMYLAYALIPRGWIQQNTATIARIEQMPIEAVDPRNQLIDPAKADRLGREIDKICAHWGPYTILCAIAVPNCGRAMQTTARNQTTANEALIACALERYRLANGQYPETLDALVPQFIAELPHDLIGGQPLKYRRTDPPSSGSNAAGGGFILYSIGWNEKDDGGQDLSGKDRWANVDQGDWVWPVPAN